jgi:hypothetical protein
VVEFDSEYVRGAAHERTGNGAAAGTDLNDGSIGQVPQRRCNPFDGLCVDEEVLSELGFGRHVLFRW